MATIQPKGEKERQAVTWISENLQKDEKRPIYRLIQDAAYSDSLYPQSKKIFSGLSMKKARIERLPGQCFT